MSIDLLAVRVVGQGQGIEGIVDACGVEGSEVLLRRRRIQAGKVEAAGLLSWRGFAFGQFGGQRGLFLFQQSIFLRLLAGGLGGFRGCCFAVDITCQRSESDGVVVRLAYALLLSLAPLAHSAALACSTLAF